MHLCLGSGSLEKSLKINKVNCVIKNGFSLMNISADAYIRVKVTICQLINLKTVAFGPVAAAVASSSRLSARHSLADHFSGSIQSTDLSSPAAAAALDHFG